MPQPTPQRFREKLTGVKIGRRGKKTTVITYADDVMIIVSKPEDVPVVRETLKIYEKATGATINIQKSKALALGSWNTSVQIMNIPCYEEIKC
jgi:23S rRNA-/tRNA-specific pseudouridylate synthase